GFGPRSRKPDHAGAGRAILLAPTDGTASGHEGSEKPQGIPIKGYATLRQRLSGSRLSCSRPPPAAASTRPFWLLGGDSLRASGCVAAGQCPRVASFTIGGIRPVWKQI